MFFDERDSESAQSEVAQIGQFSPGLPATLSERVAVEYRAQVRDRNMNSLLDNRAALLDEQVRRAKELGYNLKRPKVPGEGGVNTPEAISAYNAMVDKIEAETGVGLIRLNQPVIGRGYPGEGSPDRNVSGGGAWEPLDRELQKRAFPERAEEADIRARTPGFGGFVASIAGGAAGSFKDPVVALTTPLGAPGGAGFWKTVLTEAAINMALEVPTQGLLIQEARERGIEVTFGTAAVDVLTAGVAGAGFSAAAEGLSRGLIKAFEKVGDVKVKKIVKKLEAGEDLSLAEKATMAAEIDRQMARATAQEAAALVDEITDARPLTSSEQFARDAVDIDAEVQRSPFGDDLEADIRHRANLERILEDIVNEEPEIRLDNDGVIPEGEIRADPDFEQVKTPPVMDRNFVEADQTPVAAATRELDYLLDEKTPDAEVKLVADERLAQLGNEVIGVDEATGKSITAKGLLEEFDREEKLLEAMRFCKIR